MLFLLNFKGDKGMTKNELLRKLDSDLVKNSFYIESACNDYVVDEEKAKIFENQAIQDIFFSSENIDEILSDNKD